MSRGRTALSLLAFTAAATAFATAASAQTTTPATRAATLVYVFGIPVDFFLFALTLIGVAIFHHVAVSYSSTSSSCSRSPDGIRTPGTRNSSASLQCKQARQ